MLRVLHVIQSLDPSWGGIARVVPELAAQVGPLGIESTIATLGGGRYGHPPITQTPVHTFAASDNRLGSSPAFAAATGELVSAADVVHLHGLWTDQNRTAGAAARRLGKPYLMTPHSMMMPWAWRRSWWKKRPIGWWFEHRNLRRAACLHALSAGEAAAMRALGFNPRIEVIPNGVDVPASRVGGIDSRPADGDAPHAGGSARDGGEQPDLLAARHPDLAGRRRILFLSRIHPQKNIETLVDAWLEVAPHAPDWRLVVAGPDEVGLRAALESAAARRGADARVAFVGMLDGPTARSALAHATVLAQPSHSEGLSMSLLEALAAAVPLLISPACNMPEVAESGAGWIVEPRRAAIADALRRIVAVDETVLADLRRRASALAAQRFDWTVVRPKYAALYQRIADGIIR